MDTTSNPKLPSEWQKALDELWPRIGPALRYLADRNSHPDRVDAPDSSRHQVGHEGTDQSNIADRLRRRK
jgi:hypothetical protein